VEKKASLLHSFESLEETRVELTKFSEKKGFFQKDAINKSFFLVLEKSIHIF